MNGRPRQPLAILYNVSVMLGIVLCAWVLFCLIGLYRNVGLLMNAGGYRPATFHVEKLVYKEYEDGSDWWAEGTIDKDHREKFDLRGYLSRSPRSQEELESQVRAGQRFPVLYNPDVSGSRGVQSEMTGPGNTLRVIKPVPDLAEHSRANVLILLAMAGVPALLWFLLYRAVGKFQKP